MKICAILNQIAVREKVSVIKAMPNVLSTVRIALSLALLFLESLPVITGIGMVALMRLANLVITKQKFKQWGMLHSLGNKLTGLALLSSIEEMVILLRSKWYEPNPKGFFRIQ